jgi:uncharacterized protein YaaR (DUF327 family)
MKNAIELRTLVQDNALTLGRLTADQLGNNKDYSALTSLYRNALDALTEWASKDYAHKSTQDDLSNAFESIKAILSLFTVSATNEEGEEVVERIVIDQASMRTMRDCATKPKRMYSAAYTKAEKARKEQAKTALSRYEDLLTLGAPAREEDEELADYIKAVKESGINTVSEGIDMLEMYQAAMATLAVKTKAVEDIKDLGNWTWRRPVAVDLNTFADLIENYIADCLMDGYNIKSSKTVREEKAEARKAAKEAKDAEKKEQAAA